MTDLDCWSCSSMTRAVDDPVEKRDSRAVRFVRAASGLLEPQCAQCILTNVWRPEGVSLQDGMDEYLVQEVMCR